MSILSGIFASTKLYAGNWEKRGERLLTAEEKRCIKRAEIVDSQYGPSCCFFLTTGQRAYFPVSSKSSLGVGDAVDLETVKFVTLWREGDGTIERIE